MRAARSTTPAPTLTLILTFTLALMLAGCGGGGAQRVAVMMNWVPYGEHAPFYYGVKQGFYRAEGIDLAIRPGAGSGKTIQAVAAGQVTFGWADTPALIKAVAAGMPVRSVGAYLQTTPTAFEFFADKGIRSPADLRGRSVAVTPGDAAVQVLPAFLARNGLAAGDLALRNVDAAGKVAALTEGQVDAIIGFFHDQAPTIEARSGRKVAFLKYADWGVDYLGTGLVVNERILRERPDLVERMVRATTRSWQAAAADPDAAVAAMAELGGLAPQPAVARAQLGHALTLLHTKATRKLPPGVNSEADWLATIETMRRHTGLSGPGTPSTYWDGSFARKLVPAPSPVPVPNSGGGAGTMEQAGGGGRDVGR